MLFVFSNYFSGLGRALGRVCVSVFVTEFSNEMTFDPI